MRTGVHFGILGPIRVWRGDDELNAGAPQQRMILGLLLARAGSVVSQTELVGAVWGARPPASAANVLHRSIGQLRRVMEPDLPVRAEGSLLTRIGAGYRIRVEAPTFDLLAFRDLVIRARAGATPEDAVGLYVRAFALWRGTCAAGLEPAGGPYPAFADIDGERSQAVRDATDVALRAGLVTRVLPALRAAATAHPLDESLQSRLVLALAAAGEREKAREVYRAVRERLADELGIDPGGELRSAYGMISRGVGRAQPAPDLSRPAQLPPEHPFFVPRPEAADRALALLAGQPPTGPAVLTVGGMPGVGKSTLAVHLAHRLAAAHPDGQLYADLRAFDGHSTAMRPAEALRGFLTCLGVPARTLPTDVAGLTRRYREVLAGRRVLVVLDDCRDAGQIRPLLPGPGCTVIATSRLPLGCGGATLRLTLPGTREATAILAARIGDAQTAADLVARHGRLPSDLALAAARVLTHA